ncbi:hypothetical protein [Breoghania sp.]|uniref:hypothetical protein n=1 Tax=Breoghania sp. TaxID=2065378 RepID=UPI0029CA6FF9|nr:hypothetical protein [Breoghania sp.]
MFYGFFALFALTAYVAGVVALGIWIAATYGPLEAALSIAAAMVALAALALLAVLIANRIDRRRFEARDRQRAATASLVLTLLPTVARSRALTMTAIAGGLAFVALNMLSGDDSEAPDA